MKLILLLAIGSALSSGSAWAHPVSYKGAFAVMSWNQPFLSDSWLAYSFRPDLAIAARGMRMTMKSGQDMVAYLPQLDVLVKRWNGDSSQANVYVYGGGGGVSLEGRHGSAGLVGAEADAESRRLFALAKYEVMAPNIAETFHHVEARLGIAPYEAEIDELASWFMVQAQYHPSLSRSLVVTPMARFFYKSVLWETGVSLRGDWMLNLMFHF